MLCLSSTELSLDDSFCFCLPTLRTWTAISDYSVSVPLDDLTGDDLAGEDSAGVDSTILGDDSTIFFLFSFLSFFFFLSFLSFLLGFSIYSLFYGFNILPPAKSTTICSISLTDSDLMSLPVISVKY